MEGFYKEISQKLEEKSNEFGKHIEPKHKVIIANSYQCMADCYRSPGSIEVASNCAEKCHSKVQYVHNELQGIVENIQTYFQSCIQTCRVGHSKKEDDAKQCINECTNGAMAKFSSAVSVAEEIVNKYL
jgi:hypothetical protein